MRVSRVGEPQSQYTQDYQFDRERQERRAALMGIVDGIEELAMGHGGPTGTIVSDYESDYAGERVPALAISGSGEVEANAQASVGGGHAGDDAESESDYEDDQDQLDDEAIERQEHDHRYGRPLLTPVQQEHPYMNERSWDKCGRDTTVRKRSSSATRYQEDLPKHGAHRYSTSSRQSRPISQASHSQPQLQTQERPVSYEAVRLAQHSHLVAAKERQAFGLPPSESDDLYTNAGTPATQNTNGRGNLAHEDSVLSDAVGGGSWQHHHDEEELSTGAASMFQKLGGDDRGHVEEEYTPIASPAKRRSRRSDTLVPSTTIKGSDAFSPRVPVPVYTSSDDTPVGLWQSTLDLSARRNLIATYGPREMQRQDLIHTIYRSECTFVERLGIVVKLFIQPLRMQDTKLWIDGVPSDVANLLDWLEDIANLHGQIVKKLQLTMIPEGQEGGRQQQQQQVVIRFSAALREFVPRMEIYQPYLLRYEEVVQSLQRLVEDTKSDFGEFVRIREAEEGLGKWTLTGLLQDPMRRLGECRDLFRVCSILQCSGIIHPYTLCKGTVRAYAKISSRFFPNALSLTLHGSGCAHNVGGQGS
jgi:hypothetical protein